MYMKSCDSKTEIGIDDEHLQNCMLHRTLTDLYVAPVIH